MHFAALGRILGMLLMLFSLTQVPPLLIALYDGGEARHSFSLALSITLLTGLCIWYPLRHRREELRVRDGYVLTASFWFVLASFGAMPFYLSLRPEMGLVDSIFEAFSGLSTTGATVLTGIDSLPRAILYYRQQLQWLGGMGIVVLAVAIMPMLGVGGMQLYRSEIPGPVKDNKLSPRIADTAKTLWIIYCGLTVLCALAYAMAGMSWFDAIGHSFSTIAIGGFSTHDASIGYFDSFAIELIAVVFMVLSGMNFGLHFLALRSRSLKAYLKDPECMTFLKILSGAVVITVFVLVFYQQYSAPTDTLRHALFQVVSVATTTGFAVTDFSGWPSFLPYFLIYISFIGACAGSTGGGMKVMRVMLMFRQGQREIQRLLHPNGVFMVKMGKRTVPDRVIEAVWGFSAVYLVTFFTLMLALLACELDPITAFSTLASCMNNLGPALGEASQHYAELSSSAKLILSVAMILGRLEVFSLLILFTPAFWRY